MNRPTFFAKLFASEEGACRLFVIVTLVACGCLLRTANAHGRLKVNPAEQSQETLNPAEVLSRQISGGENQTFAVLLTQGQYAEIRVEQHGSVLLVTLLDPVGREVIQMDSPSGGHGPIFLSATAATSGIHHLQVRSVNKWSIKKTYEVVLETLRKAEAEDERLIDAEKAFSAGRQNYRSDNPAIAVTHYDRARSYWRASTNYHWQALTEYALSEAYRNLNREKSEECLNETLRILDLQMAPNDWRLRASALNDLGTIYGAAGQDEKATSVLKEALGLFVSNQDPRGQASALGNLARIYARGGYLSRSSELIEEALALRRAENDKPGEINLLNSLGGLADQLGEPERALGYFTDALKGWESLEEIRTADRGRIAAVLSNLATINDKLGRWDQARDYYDKALEKYSEGDPNRAATLDNKGELYASLGDSEKAKDCYDKALSLLSVEKPDRDIKASILVHLGQLAMGRGDTAEGVRDFEQARGIQPAPARLADVLTNLGAALAAQGDFQRASAAYQSALDIQVKLRDRRGQAITLQKRGESLRLSGEHAKSIEDLNEALTLWRAVEDRRGEAATLNDIALLERDRGNLVDALASSGRAISVVESQRTTLSSRQLRASYFATQESFYELNIDLKMQLAKSGSRSGYLASALEASEMARSRVLLDTLSEAGIDRPEFSQTGSPNAAAPTQARARLLQRLASKAQARTKLLSGPHTTEQVAILAREINEIAENCDVLEAEMRSQVAALRRPRPSSLKEIQQELDGETLLLEYSLGERHSFVWAVTFDSIEGFELPGRSQIEAAARRMVEVLTVRNRSEGRGSAKQTQERLEVAADNNYAEVSNALTRMVLTPVASLLQGKRLVFVADGALQMVPFASLPSPAQASDTPLTGRGPNASSVTMTAQKWVPLIAEHQIVTLPSASVLVLQRRELGTRKPAALAVAVVADPVFDPNDQRVKDAVRAQGKTVAQNQTLTQKQSGRTQESAAISPAAAASETNSLNRALRDAGLGEIPLKLFHSREEAEAIMKVVPNGQGIENLDFKASRATAMSAELSKYRIIHFATHGMLDLEHPELSGLLLSMVDEKGQPLDGYLRLHDIYNLNLPADLVVLSACETGVGKQVKGEGLIALTRGFMYAGAKSVVASLWKVDDVATSVLMAEFYKEMFSNKLKPAAALRQAQLTMSKSKRHGSPYYWAGFTIQGDWK